MKKVLSGVLLVAAAAIFMAGIWFGRRTGMNQSPANARQILYYVDPMHPAYHSDRPGVAPDCGMQLEPVYAGGANIMPVAGGLPAAGGAATIHITPERQQLIGVRVEAAEYGAGSFHLRTVGRVSAVEDRIHRIVTGVDGSTRETFAGFSGSLVRKGQVLATIYSRDFQTAEQAYFYALNAAERSQDDGASQAVTANAQIQAAEDNLHSLGMTDVQIHEIAKTRKPTRDIEVRAPVDGLVTARNVFPGLRFERGTELYRIVDLSKIWIVADLFQNEGAMLSPGTAVRFTVPHQGRSYRARVTDIPPQFDAATRTLKVRLEADNPGALLRPDMFVDVELDLPRAPALTVPADAVVDSGMSQHLFVERGAGSFEVRTVETGVRTPDRVAITRGLRPGERVVVAGTFLVDSESRLRTAAAEANGPANRDPVCGMEIDTEKARAAGKVSTYRGKTYAFCSEHCKRKFDEAPAPYVPSSGNESHRARSTEDQRPALSSLR